MSMKNIFAVGIAATLMFAGTANAFDVVNFGTHTKNGVEETVIAVAGAIMPGDGKRLVEQFEKFKEAKTLWIGSPGGSFVDSLKIADYVNKNNIKVVIPPDEACASGCAMIFFASKEKTIHFTSKIGVHRAVSVPYDSKTKTFLYDKKVEDDSSRVIDNIMLYKYIQWDVPANIITAMMTTSQLSDVSIKFFNSVDLHDSGLEHKIIFDDAENMGEFKVKVPILN